MSPTSAGKIKREKCVVAQGLGSAGPKPRDFSELSIR